MQTKILLTVAGSAVLLLTACGGGSGDLTSTAATGAPTRSSGQSLQGAFRPGAAGTIAAIDGKTMQVQSQQTGQVAVTWTAKTTFSRTVSAKASDVSVGDCVVVRSTTQSEQASIVTAQTVSIDKPVNGSCQQRGFGGPGGFPGGNGSRPSGAPSGFPSGLPSGAPTGGPPGAGQGDFVRPAIGEVTQVSGDSFTVEAVSFGFPGGSSSSPSTSPVSVRTTPATTFTTTATGSANQLRVGECATAIGSADDTGAVTAQTVSTRPAENGSCDTFGFGGPGGGGPGGQQ